MCNSNKKFDKKDIAIVYDTLKKRIVRARINESMAAADEIKLQELGKVVKAEQSLRDKLKTFSSLAKQ